MRWARGRSAERTAHSRVSLSECSTARSRCSTRSPTSVTPRRLRRLVDYRAGKPARQINCRPIAYAIGSQLQLPQCLSHSPITVVQHGVRHVVGEGMPSVDRKGNLRISGMSSSTPQGEYVRTLVGQCVLRYAELEYTDTIDDAGNLVRQVPGGVFILPTDPPPAPGDDTGGAEPASELLGLAARIYTATPAQRAVLAGQLIACAVALRGAVPAPQAGKSA